MADTIFMGNSRYSKDFGSVLDRSIAIASLPLTQMKQQSTVLNDEASAYSGLAGKLGTLRTAADDIAKAMDTAMYNVSVSDGAVLSATMSTGVMAGSYKIEITDLGAQTNTMSSVAGQKVADPRSQNIAASPFTLQINSGEAISIDANNLTDLVAQINAKAGSSVQASLVNVGSGSSPDYRLTLQGRSFRNDTLSLKAGNVELLSTLTPGSPVKYKVNGASEQTSDTRTIEISPGLTFTAKASSQSGVPTTIDVSRSGTSLAKALTSFAAAYNSVVDEIGKHRGQNSGVLKGSSVIGSVESTLRSLALYQANSSNLRTGFTIDKTGHLSADSAAIQTAGAGDLQQLVSALGAKGSDGFLKFASEQLTSLDDTKTGVLQNAISRLHDTKDAQDQRITQEQERIDRMKESLQQQLGSADALIATLEQQATYISSMFTAMRVNSQNL